MAALLGGATELIGNNNFSHREWGSDFLTAQGDQLSCCINVSDYHLWLNDKSVTSGPVRVAVCIAQLDQVPGDFGEMGLRGAGGEELNLCKFIPL